MTFDESFLTALRGLFDEERLKQREMISEIIGAARSGEPELVSVAAAARAVSTSTKTILRGIRSGRIRAERIGRQWRVRVADVTAGLGAPARADANDVARRLQSPRGVR